MIPNLNPVSKEKKTNKILVAFLGIILVVSSLCFTALGDILTCSELSSQNTI